MRMLSAISLFLFLLSPAAAEPLSGDFRCDPQTVSGSADVNAYRLVQFGNAYEVLRDSAAFEYLADKRLRNPERFVGMARALSARGYRPTDEVVVLRSLGPANTPPNSPHAPTVPMKVATTYQSSQGEQIFWSWDDGDDSTWEGSQYVERYSDGAWVTFDGQLDISSADVNANWADLTGSSSGGILNRNTSWFGSDGSSAGIALAVRSGEWPRLLRFAQEDGTDPGTEDPEPLNRDWQDRLQAWAACISGGCAGCAGACAFSGPGFAACFGPCCFGVSIACAIDYYFGP